MELSNVSAVRTSALVPIRPLPRTAVKRVLLALGCSITVIAAGNLLILGLHLWASAAADPSGRVALPGIHNFRVVDEKVWRGSRPSTVGYEALAEAGVTTIVDLRAESGLDVPVSRIQSLGMGFVRIPIRDGQTPNDSQVDRFLRVIRDAPGTVYVHCMAGVGRTGTMVAAYLVAMKDLSASAALQHNLSVGPPSLEQLAFVSEIDNPNVVVTGISRLLDAPRRLLTYIK